MSFERKESLVKKVYEGYGEFNFNKELNWNQRNMWRYENCVAYELSFYSSVVQPKASHIATS